MKLWRGLRIGLAVAAGVLLLLALWTPGRVVGPGSVQRAVAADDLDPSRTLLRLSEAPSLLVDRNNENLVYLSGIELATGQCRFYVSTDRAVSWRRETAPELDPYTRNCAMGSSQPQNLRTELTQGPDGTIFYVFQGNDPGAGGSRSVLVARSTDGGRSWRTALVAAGPRATQPAEVEVNFEGHLAVDTEDPTLVYVLWRRSYPRVDPAVPPRATQPYMAVSTDGGLTFGEPRLMLDTRLGSDGPRPLVVGGRLYAFYLEPPPPLPAASDLPSPTLPSARLFAAVSTDRGRTWSSSEIASAQHASEPVPVYDAKRQRFSVVWHDNRNEELDVFISTSADARRWSPPHRLNDDPLGTRVGQHYPQVSISAGGRIDVAWYDWRDDPFPPPSVGLGNTLGLFTNRGKVASVYLTSSRDGGRTWSRNVKVNDVPIDRTIGTWANNYDVLVPPAIASFPSGAIVSWSDTRYGTSFSQTQDIVTATVIFEHTSPRRVTGLQAAFVGGLLGAGVTLWLVVWLLRRGPARPGVSGPGVVATGVHSPGRV